MTAAYTSTEQARVNFYGIIARVRTQDEVVSIHTRKGTVVVLSAEKYAVLTAKKK